MVINGFFDEEIMPKVDALEKTTIDRINQELIAELLSTQAESEAPADDE